MKWLTYRNQKKNYKRFEENVVEMGMARPTREDKDVDVVVVGHVLFYE